MCGVNCGCHGGYPHHHVGYMGYYRWPYPARFLSVEEEIAMLKSYKSGLSQEIEAIERRIEELEKK